MLDTEPKRLLTDWTRRPGEREVKTLVSALSSWLPFRETGNGDQGLVWGTKFEMPNRLEVVE